MPREHGHWSVFAGSDRVGYSRRGVIAMEHGVPLAALTTLGLGGAAAHFVRARDPADLTAALRWGAAHNRPVWILGGGSNVVVADSGLDGLVIQPAMRGIRIQRAGDRARVVVAAGEPWDGVVRVTTEARLCGIECLSGIPGLAGATPIQNVGAYGQEIGDVVRCVRVWDREASAMVELSAADCGFRYRNSILRQQPGRWVVVELELELRVGDTPQLRYAELAQRFDGVRVTPASVRDAVLALRRGKSMVIDPSDPNHCSAGSFFTNPIVEVDKADRVAAIAERADVARTMPRWPAGEQVKLAAGWLIEAAGVRKGDRDGAIGVSSAHALALVHHGGGTTAQLLTFARSVRDRVRDRFDVELRPEPVMLGVEW